MSRTRGPIRRSELTHHPLSTFSYLAMASGMGIAFQRQFENAADGSRILRQVFYARYIDWCK